MPALSRRSSPILLSSRACASKPQLTPEEWEMILEALSAYRHNAAYRGLYDKLVSQKP